MRFLLKVVIIFSEEKERFDYKNNHRYSKSVNFCLNNINKSNCKTLVVFSYTLSRFGPRKVKLVRRVFKLSVPLLYYLQLTPTNAYLFSIRKVLKLMIESKIYTQISNFVEINHKIKVHIYILSLSPRKLMDILALHQLFVATLPLCFTLFSLYFLYFWPDVEFPAIYLAPNVFC